MTEWPPAKLDRLAAELRSSIDQLEVEIDALRKLCIVEVNDEPCDCYATHMIAAACCKCPYVAAAPVCAGHVEMFKELYDDPAVTAAHMGCGGAFTYAIEEL